MHSGIGKGDSPIKVTKTKCSKIKQRKEKNLQRKCVTNLSFNGFNASPDQTSFADDFTGAFLFCHTINANLERHLNENLKKMEVIVTLFNIFIFYLASTNQ